LTSIQAEIMEMLSSCARSIYRIFQSNSSKLSLPITMADFVHPWCAASN